MDSGDFGSLRSKKPFCNAFTGCGRKRSDPAMAEDELMNLLAQRIQGIRDQVSHLAESARVRPNIATYRILLKESGYSNAGIVKRQDVEDYILN